MSDARAQELHDPRHASALQDGEGHRGAKPCLRGQLRSREVGALGEVGEVGDPGRGPGGRPDRKDPRREGTSSPELAMAKSGTPRPCVDQASTSRSTPGCLSPLQISPSCQPRDRQMASRSRGVARASVADSANTRVTAYWTMSPTLARVPPPTSSTRSTDWGEIERSRSVSCPRCLPALASRPGVLEGPPGLLCLALDLLGPADDLLVGVLRGSTDLLVEPDSVSDDSIHSAAERSPSPVYGAGLLNRLGWIAPRGFESPPLRQSPAASQARTARTAPPPGLELALALEVELPVGNVVDEQDRSDRIRDPDLGYEGRAKSAVRGVTWRSTSWKLSTGQRLAIEAPWPSVSRSIWWRTKKSGPSRSSTWS